MSKIIKPWARHLRSAGLALLATALVLPYGIQAAEDAAPGGISANYVTAEVTRGDILRYASAAPTVEWMEQYPLEFPYAGATLEEILVSDNAHVTEGQPLLRFQRDVPESTLARLELQLERTLASHADEQAAMDAQLEALADAADTPANVRARGRLDIEYDAMRARQDAERTTLQTELETLRDDYETTHLLAPADGMIVNMARLRPGERLQPDTRLMDFRNPEAAYLVLEERPELFPYGRTAELTFGFANNPIHSEATVIDNPNLGELNREDGRIFLEMTPEAMAEAAEALDKDPETFTLQDMNNLRMNVIEMAVYDTLIIPRNALSQAQGQSYVYVLEDDVIRRRYIQAGISDMENVQVIDGLTEGQTLVIR